MHACNERERHGIINFILMVFVDISTGCVFVGYEKTLFKRMNEKQATEREAYLWSVSDM